MAGCPRCSRDLIAVNSHKPAVTHPNGFRTFKELRAGERLNLPDRWFDGSLDRMPPTYFAALPHHDGVTSGVSGALGDQAQFGTAAAQVGALAAMGDQQFSAAVDAVADTIDASVREVVGTTAPGVYAVPYAQEVRKATDQARRRSADLMTAITAGNQPAAFQARSDILHDLSGALTSAGLALQAFYGDTPSPPPPSGNVLVDIGPAKIDPATVVAAAKAAAAAIASDPNYCAAVAVPHSAVNTAVHAFKTAWNAANPSNPVPINTSNYEQATAAVLAHLLGTAPVACGAGAAPVPPPPVIVPPRPQSGLGVGGVLGLGLLGAGAVGGAIYYVTRHPLPRRKPKVRRVPAEPGDFS
jgi:hypothetical protein